MSQIRFHLPLCPDDQATQEACDSLVGQNTRFDGHPAMITAAWLDDGGIEVEVEAWHVRPFSDLTLYSYGPI